MTVHFVESADGWRLGLRETPAQGEEKGVVVALHAMMVDARTLDRPTGAGLATSLAAAGWTVLSCDFRGRGVSGPDWDAGGRWDYDALVRFDVPAFVGFARKRAGNLPVVAMGHSLGGHVSVASVGTGHAQVDMLVLLSANIWRPSLEPSWTRRLMKAWQVWLVRWSVKLFGRFPTRRFGMGPVDEASSYMDDIVRFWREDRWKGRDGLDYGAGMALVSCPVLSVVGKGDRLLAHRDGAHAWFERLGTSKKDFWFVTADEWGLATEPDHMTLVTDAPRVWSAIADWLTGVSAR